MSDESLITKAWYERRRFKVWASGLAAAVIHGTAAAGASFVGLATARGVGIDIPQLNARQLGVVLVASGLSSLFAYLRESPLPSPTDDTNHLVNPNPPPK